MDSLKGSFTDRLSLRAQKGLFVLLVMGGDYVAFMAALSLSYWIRVQFIGSWFHVPLLQTFEEFLLKLWMPVIVLGMFWYEGIYLKRIPFWEETQKVLRALFLAFLGILAIVTLDKMSKEVSRAIILETGFFSCFFVPFVRIWWKPFLHNRGLGIEKILIIGESRSSSMVASGLDRDHYMGLRATGWMTEPSLAPEIDSDHEGITEETSKEISFPFPFLGNLKSLPDVVREEKIYSVIVAYPMIRAKTLSKLVSEIQKHTYSVYVIPNLSQVNLINSELLYFFYEEIFLLRIRNNLKSRLNREIKAVLDYTGTLILMAFALPIMAMIAIGIWMTSRGSIFYQQPRMGQDGKIFKIYKFRTMFEGADETLQDLLKNNPDLDAEYRKNRKLQNDPRVTSIGKLLRMTSLDELPQFFNVLRGEMSLVGPRPAFEDEILENYRELGSEYFLVKPGITGLWQVSGRSDNDFSMRVRLDLWYIRNWSLWLDLVILVRTVGVVFFRKGAV